MQYDWNQYDWNLRRIAWVAVLLAAVAAGAGADESEVPPPVSLDKLLTVPRTVELSDPRPGGATRAEWQARFAEVRAERAKAQAALEAAQAELGEMAADSSQWKMKAPGLGAQSTSGETGPMSYRLSTEIRHHREEIERADRRLQALRVEAGLAGVPDEWIEPAGEAKSAPDAEK